jgi:predicted outer membrane repeat protein
MRFLLAVCVATSWAGLAGANTITVTSSSGGSKDGSGCTLRDAITAADTDAPYGDCAAGSGDDVIEISAAGPINFTMPHANGSEDALPQISTNLTIHGNGAILQRDPNLATCVLDGSSDSGKFRLVTVESPTVTPPIVVIDRVQIIGFCQDGFSLPDDGAIANYGDLTITSARFKDNQASGFGGAIYNYGALVLSEVTFDSNQALSGGALFQEGASTSAVISASAFLQNVAIAAQGTGGGGGAIEHGNGSTVILNSTFSANQGDYGAALFAISGSVATSFVTFADNVLTGAHAADNAVVQNYATITLKSVLMDTPLVGANCLNGGTFNALGDNLSADASCTGFTLSSANPQLESLGDYGGPTPTYALPTGSPAIDAASDCLDASGQPVADDQRGLARPQGGQCDLGAFEWQDVIFASKFE